MFKDDVRRRRAMYLIWIGLLRGLSRWLACCYYELIIYA